MPSWNEILHSIQSKIADGQAIAASASDTIRRKFLTDLHNKTGRHVIAYYSGFLSKPHALQADINNEDLNGFMMAVHKMKKHFGLDLLLHTPGGSLSATLSIVHYLRQKFDNDIRAIVPQIAMSAGTMIACSCKRIIMARHSQLGPTDPHLRGIPASGVLAEFERAIKEVKADPSTITVWQCILGQIRPAFLSQCKNTIKWSENFVREQLRHVMFENDKDAAKKAAAIVKKLTDYTGNRSHDRPIHYEECRKIGLKVDLLEDDEELQDIVLSIHHCYMNAFMNGMSYKITENHLGAAIVKNDTSMFRELRGK